MELEQIQAYASVFDDIVKSEPELAEKLTGMKIGSSPIERDGDRPVVGLSKTPLSTLIMTQIQAGNSRAELGAGRKAALGVIADTILGRAARAIPEESIEPNTARLLEKMEAHEARVAASQAEEKAKEADREAAQAEMAAPEPEPEAEKRRGFFGWLGR